MPLLSMPPPPAVQAPAPTQVDAEQALLEAFDWERPLPPVPALKGPKAAAYHWLRLAATFDPAGDLPANPFPAAPERKEVEALRALIQAPRAQVRERLVALPMKTTGTALALWRWGRRQVRSGAFDAATRRAWEDRLLGEGPALTRGYSLRHALCWALAEQDDARLATLRSHMPPGSEAVLQGFQRLFGLLGSPSPVLRLWSLPGLAYQDLRLDQLGGTRLWIAPLQADALPTLPSGTAWIIPSETGILGDRDASLPPLLQTEGEAMAARLQAAGRSAHFAPSRAAFEQMGLAWFPILIDLDSHGHIQGIHMGDAAPAKP